VAEDARAKGMRAIVLKGHTSAMMVVTPARLLGLD